MIKKHFTITNVNGISSRSYALLVAEANRYKSNLTLLYEEEEANLKSIMNVMALIICYQGEFDIIASGFDEENAIDHLTKIVEHINNA